MESANDQSKVGKARKPRAKTGGRVAGTLNKATREIKEVARGYGPECIERLWALAGAAESDAAKVAAIKEILDRGYGKATQTLEHTDPSGGNPFAPLMELIAANGRPRPGSHR